MTAVGEIKEIPKELDFEWVIPNFDLSKKIESYSSPYFSFANKSWVLWLYPNGRSEDNTVGHVCMYLVDQSSTSSENIKVSLGLKIFDENNSKEMLSAKLIGKSTYVLPHYLSKSEFLQRATELLPFNNLTVLCTLKYSESADKPSDIVIEKCSHCKEVMGAKDISAHEKMRVDKPMKCPECLNVVVLKNWYDLKCQMPKANASEKVLDDLKNIMVSGDHSDTIIQVKGEEFRLHRTILGARNPIFDSMFKSDMKEKKMGIVTIDDCQPNVFRSFIHYLYTGEVDKLSQENVCDLFKVADKYQENQLKKDCLEFMMNSISVENFCDFIIVAVNHDEKELLGNATNFFASKTKEIICSMKWLTFLQEHPVYANELHIKALDIHRSLS